MRRFRASHGRRVQAKPGPGGALTERQRLELMLGPNLLASWFRSDNVRRQAYFDHQDELHEGLPPGRRPWAFWSYVLGGNPDVNEEPRRLAERDLLHPDEEAEIIALASTDAALAAAATVILNRRPGGDFAP